ncbi:HAD-IA family hydrolase [Castellaniella sp.]|uniref:HAD family hydrolase n=1 Tax=Castellaniella sp. TaxID=1955812 RepID=UPI002AFF7B7D|nr:HAD-IA family hydrolase [Castellaniella sp.]
MSSYLILFDFDGTLADTAPDLAAAANRQREYKGLPPLPYEALRPYASHGARGLLKAALDLDPGTDTYEHTRAQFLQDYAQGMLDQACLFPGVQALLDQLNQADMAWGIVTNKVEYLALPMVQHLGLQAHCRVTVGGDTTPHTKPHPEPLLHAARQAGFAPSQCLYAGDDERDILAGKAAGMATVAAAYGYCSDDPAGWAADAIARQPADLWPIIQRWAEAQPNRQP